MKYSEFLQLSEILEKDGITVSDYVKTSYLPINEGLLGNLFKLGGKALWGLINKGAKSAISKGIEEKVKKKLDADANTIKLAMMDKLNPGKDDKGNEIVNDEVIQKLDQEGDSTLDAVLKKRYPNLDRTTEQGKKTVASISQKVNKNRDQKIIKYMEEVLKNESDKVLKSISEKDNMSDKDKENCKLYWQSKMTVLQIELSILLSQKGYIDERNMDSYMDVLQSRYENLMNPPAEPAAKAGATSAATGGATPTPAATSTK